MSWRQLIVPDPWGPVPEEAMCLQYVRETFGLEARYGSATEAWQQSRSQHLDRDYPQGVWFAVWWALDKNVNGHVALVAPTGEVYSTSNLAPHPLKVHPNVADVEAYYARYGFTLTYRGWTEDVAGTPVITNDGSAAHAPGSIADMASTVGEMMALTQKDIDAVALRTLQMKMPRQTKDGKTDDLVNLQVVLANTNQTNGRILDGLKGLSTQLASVEKNLTAHHSTTHQKLNGLTTLVQSLGKQAGLSDKEIQAAISDVLDHVVDIQAAVTPVIDDPTVSAEAPLTGEPDVPAQV